MAILDGLLTLLDQLFSQLVTIPLDNVVAYLYTFVNLLILVLFGEAGL